MESSEFLSFSFESDSSSDQPVDSAYVKHYKWLKGEEHVIMVYLLHFVQTVTKSMTWSSVVAGKKCVAPITTLLQSFRATSTCTLPSKLSPS